jgi:hypothetical protein
VKKEKVVINNKNKRHLAKRVGCPEHRRGGRRIPPRSVNKQARPGWRGSGGSGGMRPAMGKLVTVAEGGKLHRRGGKTHLSREL